MVKLVLLFHQPEDEALFETYYAQNLQLLEKMPGIIRRQANIVWGGPQEKVPYYRILEFYFENRAALETAMTSTQGTAAGKDLMNYAANLVELFFVDVFEDDTPLN